MLNRSPSVHLGLFPLSSGKRGQIITTSCDTPQLLNPYNTVFFFPPSPQRVCFPKTYLLLLPLWFYDEWQFWHLWPWEAENSWLYLCTKNLNAAECMNRNRSFFFCRSPIARFLFIQKQYINFLLKIHFCKAWKNGISSSVAIREVNGSSFLKQLPTSMRTGYHFCPWWTVRLLFMSLAHSRWLK